MAEWAECSACSTTAAPGSCGTDDVAAGVTTGASAMASLDSSGCESGVRRRVTSAVTVDTICSSSSAEMAALGASDAVARLTAATVGKVEVEAPLEWLAASAAALAVADERLLRGRREGGWLGAEVVAARFGRVL